MVKQKIHTKTNCKTGKLHRNFDIIARKENRFVNKDPE